MSRRRTISGWECRGSVRGDCGVIHRTRANAEKHIRQDHNDCNVVGGYSNRYPVWVGKDEEPPRDND